MLSWLPVALLVAALLAAGTFFVLHSLDHHDDREGR